MDDLEINPLYRAFLEEFKGMFQVACKMSYVIAIPHSDCFDEIHTINRSFASQHILTPSKLLKQHFNPLQDDFLEDVELDNRKLICLVSSSHKSKLADCKFEANILAEMTGCNQQYARYQILVIDKVLSPPNEQPRPMTRSFLVSKFSPRGSVRQMRRCRLKPIKSLLDHDSCGEFLDSISQKITQCLEADLNRLQSNYLILPGYLEDAAQRIQTLADSYIPKYEHAAILGDTFNTVLCELSRRDIRLSVENYMVYLLHGKLMTSIQNWHLEDDRRVLEQFHKIYSAKLTVCQLGAHRFFADFHLTDELALELVHLPAKQSPLAIVTSLSRVFNLIEMGLSLSVRLKSLTGLVTDQTPICADDLIATFVFILAQVRPPKLYSLSKYLQTFSRTSSLRDRQAYYVTTFQLVVEYVFNYDEFGCQDDHENKPEAIPVKSIQKAILESTMTPNRQITAT